VLTLDPDFVDKVALQVFGLKPEHYRFVLTERSTDPAITNIAGVPFARSRALGAGQQALR
jgi:hypothetical protein